MPECWEQQIFTNTFVESVSFWDKNTQSKWQILISFSGLPSMQSGSHTFSSRWLIHQPKLPAVSINITQYVLLRSRKYQSSLVSFKGIVTVSSIKPDLMLDVGLKCSRSWLWAREGGRSISKLWYSKSGWNLRHTAAVGELPALESPWGRGRSATHLKDPGSPGLFSVTFSCLRMLMAW